MKGTNGKPGGKSSANGKEPHWSGGSNGEQTSEGDLAEMERFEQAVKGLFRVKKDDVEKAPEGADPSTSR